MYDELFAFFIRFQFFSYFASGADQIFFLTEAETRSQSVYIGLEFLSIALKDDKLSQEYSFTETINLTSKLTDSSLSVVLYNSKQCHNDVS